MPIKRVFRNLAISKYSKNTFKIAVYLGSNWTTTQRSETDQNHYFIFNYHKNLHGNRTTKNCKGEK